MWFLILLGGWLWYVVHEAEQKRLGKKTEIFPTLRYFLPKILYVVKQTLVFVFFVLCGLIGIAGVLIVWLFVGLKIVFKALWQKYTNFCYPYREIFQEIEKIKTIAQDFENYRKDELEKTKAQCQRKIFQINEIALEAETEEVFNSQQLTAFEQELTKLIEYMDWQLLSQNSQSHVCPHCNRKILVRKKAVNKVVKCPYRECRGKIKVS